VWSTVGIAYIVDPVRASSEETLDSGLPRGSISAGRILSRPGLICFDPKMPGVESGYNTVPRGPT